MQPNQRCARSFAKKRRIRLRFLRDNNPISITILFRKSLPENV